MRERQFFSTAALTAARITPARAGKTAKSSSSSNQQWDHPRSCGKDSIVVLHVFCHLGSPPLVRERPIGLSMTDTGSRITPARAGKTLYPARWHLHIQDHPRSCGKDAADVLQFAFLPGSPPLVRERRLNHSFGFHPHRITPARAGKTCKRSVMTLAYGDHPRSCGKD